MSACEFEAAEADRLAINEAYHTARHEQRRRTELQSIPGLVDQILELENKVFLLEQCLAAALTLAGQRTFERDQAWRVLQGKLEEATPNGG